ncbi:isochorismatase [Geomonas sp. Red276]
MSAPSIDWDSTAVLIMDYQNDIIAMQPEERRQPLLDNAAQVLAMSREKGIPVFYIVVRFREGYPELSPRNRMFQAVRGSGRFVEGTPGAEIHPAVPPLPGELVVTKRRVGAFSTTELDAVLRARSVTSLVLCGISTSGVVLSTVRWAADMDYALCVVSDACSDQDPEVHRVLTEKVFPRQANVVTTADLLAAAQG